jgi:preprotein translocase subunit SecD
MRAAILLVLVGCGHHDDERKPCTKPTAHLEIVSVDDNSAYMKSVYAHVGSDRHDQPTDPDAIAAGVSAEIDVWSETETKAGMELRGASHTDYYLIGHDRAALEKYLATLAPVPNDRKLVLEHVMPLPDAKDRRAYWRTYYVSTTKVIDETAIESANSVEPDDKRIYRPAVIVKLTPTGQAAFAEATAKRVGHKMATIVDGVVVTAPVLNGAIKGGSVMISMPSTSDADQLFLRLGC